MQPPNHTARESPLPVLPGGAADDAVRGPQEAPPRRHLLEPDSGLADWLAGQPAPPWRARAIRGWLHARRAESFEEMTDLPRVLRERLAECFTIWTTSIVKHQVADDGTEKLLLALADGERIECVLLRDGGRRTVCISSQVGCAMGCVFCASGLDGVVRNLSSGEILEQVLRLARLLPSDERISHVVVMGMGEPLANLDRLLPALRAAQDPDGLGISPRRITVSTVGLPKGIDRLAEETPGWHLAVSLHAAEDELRSRIVPVNRSIGLSEVMAAADRYWEASGRRLTYEYVLLGDVNDSPGDARRLVALLDGRAALVNVIPYNAVAGLPWREPTADATRIFLEILRAAGVNVQVRRRKGARIDAACGQLRRSVLARIAAPADGPAGLRQVRPDQTSQPTTSTTASTTARMPPSQPTH
jgi:23S rRNA (adenine2503-C2)-methyltransferase